MRYKNWLILVVLFLGLISPALAADADAEFTIYGFGSGGVWDQRVQMFRDGDDKLFFKDGVTTDGLTLDDFLTSASTVAISALSGTEADLETALTDVTNVIIEAEINTFALINAIVADENLISTPQIDTFAELNAIVADLNLIDTTQIDTFSELDAIVADQSLVHLARAAMVFTAGGGEGAIFDDGTNFSLAVGSGLANPKLVFTSLGSILWVNTTTGSPEATLFSTSDGLLQTNSTTDFSVGGSDLTVGVDDTTLDTITLGAGVLTWDDVTDNRFEFDSEVHVTGAFTATGLITGATADFDNGASAGALTVGNDDAADDVFTLGLGTLTWDEAGAEFDFDQDVTITGQTAVATVALAVTGDSTDPVATFTNTRNSSFADGVIIDVNGSASTTNSLGLLDVKEGTVSTFLVDADKVIRASATFEIENSAALELLTLDQDATTSPFIDFQGTADASTTASLSTLTTPGAVVRFIQIEINGTPQWIAAYADPS